MMRRTKGKQVLTLVLVIVLTVTAVMPVYATAAQGSTGEGLVTLCQVPQFQNYNMGTYQTNLVIAGLIQSYITELVDQHRNAPLGPVTMTPELIARHDRLLNDILAAWDSDPATRVFAINRAGMQARFDAIEILPNISVNYGWDGRALFFSFGGSPLQVIEFDDVWMIDVAVFQYLTQLFGRLEGFDSVLSEVMAMHFMGLTPDRSPSCWTLRQRDLYHAVGDAVGLHNLFAAARRGNAYFGNWMTRQIHALNPYFDFDYNMALRAELGAVQVRLSHLDLMSLQTAAIQAVTEAWDAFLDAIRLTGAAANHAAREFSCLIQQYYDISLRFEITPRASVFDSLRPMFDLSQQVAVEPLRLFNEEHGRNMWFVYAEPIPIPRPRVTAQDVHAPTEIRQTTIRLSIGSYLYAINGIPMQSDVAPFMDTANNRAMVPLRIVSEGLGAPVRFDDATQSVYITLATGQEVSLQIGVPLPDGMGVPVMINWRTFVPARYVSEVLGATVRWCDDTQSVYIYR